ncbi:MAG: MFS transporter [Acidobacteriota bacterium]|nr:MFS transporter [Acidobacteriota bacterium]
MDHPLKHRIARFPVRYLLVMWLFLLSAVAYLDRTNISIAGIQIGREFAIDHTRLGWVFSAFLIGYAAFQIPAGLLAHRFGPRLVLTFAALWWGLFTVLTALVPPNVSGAVMILVLVRFALGAGEATMYPATSQFVERWFPVRERGKANGIIFGGVGVGAGLTPPLVTAIILHYGWRASFWFSAAAGIATGAVWYFAARDRPEEHPLVAEYEAAHIREGRELANTETQMALKAIHVKREVPWRRIFGSKEIIALTLSYFSFGYVAWIFFGWFYIYLAEVRGLNLKASALYSMLPFVAMTVGCLLGGVASDWIARRVSLRAGRCLLPACSLAFTAVLMVVGSRAVQAESASLILAAGAGVLYIGQSCFWAVTADFGGEYSGIASGIMNMGAQIGGACTASLTPLIAKHFGWESSFFVAAVLALLGGVAWLFVDPTRSLKAA